MVRWAQIWSHWLTVPFSSWFKPSGMQLYMANITTSWNQHWGSQRNSSTFSRAEEVVITWLGIGYTKAIKSRILSQRPPTACQPWGRTLSIDYMLLECAVLQKCRDDEYYTAHSLNTLFETIPETFIVQFLWGAGFPYLIWMLKHSIQLITWITPHLMELIDFD